MAATKKDTTKKVSKTEPRKIKEEKETDKVSAENLVGEKPELKRLKEARTKGVLDKGEVEIREKPQGSLVIDERALPDSGLPTETALGVLDIAQEGSGLLRPKYQASDRDIYISASQIRRFNLRTGDLIEGQARQPKPNERYWGLLKVERVNGVSVEKLSERPNLEDLTPIYPDEKIKLSTGKEPLTTRVIDLVAPIGFGQRGLIVSPPKAGKTWLLRDIIAGIAKNYPELPSHKSSEGLEKESSPRKASKKRRGVHLMAVLIGERPEEVTDIVRHMEKVTGGMGEVAASNFDEPPRDQTIVGELALERAKRLVELGYDVVVVLDSITRMARAYNLALPTSGRTLTGGFDPVALFPAKKFFGAARKIENGGSLTIIGTCLVETGSRMDDLIYEEFKGTGNMELHLVRKLADKRIFPAIDVTRSGTRQEELLYGEETLIRIHTLRRMLETIRDDNERTETLLESLRKTESNEEYLESLKVA